MKTYIIILFLLLANISNSQGVNSGKITYEYNVTENPFKNKGKNETTKKIFADYYNNLIIYSDKIEYTLTFNKSESIYELKDNNSMEVKTNKGLNDAILLTGGLETVYIDIKQKLKFKKIEILGDNFIIRSDLKNNWQLTQEKKQIGTYVCFKAIIKNTDKPPIEAWYTPLIPVNFGPKEYCELPGLIIELKAGNIVFTAKKIVLNPKEELLVEKPKKGKVINELEFDRILKKYDKSKRVKG